jgi:hypothetical protein
MELLTTATAPLETPDECEISSAEAISPSIQIAELEFQATLRLLVERARFLTAAASSAIALEEQGKLIYCAVSGDSTPSAGATVDTSKEPIGQCIEQGKSARKEADAGNPAFALAVPIRKDEKVIGLFELRGQSTFEDRDVESVVRLAEMINTAIDHREAAEQVERKLFAQLTEIAGAAIVPSLWHAPDTTKSETPEKEPAPSPIVVATDVQKCASCGFPVSKGRSLCVECDEKIGHANSPAELFSTPKEESWISAHGYTIASALITALAVAFILWLR